MISKRSVLKLVIILCFLYCDPTSRAQSKPLQWGYIIPESFDVADIAKRVAKYDRLCIGVYRLDANGVLYRRPRLKAHAIELLKTYNLTKDLYPLISLRDSHAGAQLLQSAKARKKAVAELHTLVAANDYDGLHIDFEFLTRKSAEAFALFLKEIRESPFMQGKHLSIAAFPPLHGKPEEAAFFDLELIGPQVDEIVFMTYDYHFPNDRPGPVTHLGWARENIRIALEEKIPPEKIWLGVPAYGYDWPPTDAQQKRKRAAVLSEGKGLALCEKYTCKRHDSGTIYLEYKGRRAYFADAKTRKLMEELAIELNLKGTALWRIGFEVFPERIAK